MSSTNPLRHKVTLAQIAVGEKVADNLARMKEALQQAKVDRADWILFPEGALSGYYGGFDQSEVADAFATVQGLCKDARVVGLVSTCWSEDGASKPHNEIRVVGRAGELVSRYAKTCLTYDDAKEFSAGGFPSVHEYEGVRFGTLICNDMWVTPGFSDGPDPHLSLKVARAGACVLFHAVSSGTDDRYRSYHESNLTLRSKEAGCPFVVVNAAGKEPINCASGVVFDLEFEVALPRAGEHVETVSFTPAPLTLATSDRF
ncbi:MAG TPA: carbon-nitrogen hydrolase family protein [Polyangiaceae bacterium]|nr:carbon-nitrogen hydrolase family protein [Polyangiaceae bacterium]